MRVMASVQDLLSAELEPKGALLMLFFAWNVTISV